jgi:hypothetical protein
MNNVLSQAIQITSTEYANLIEPKFITQTEMADNFTYFVVFESENQLYKVLMTENQLFKTLIKLI